MDPASHSNLSPDIISDHHVLVVLALKEEFDYFVESLGINPVPVDWKYPYYTFNLITSTGKQIRVAVSYIGKMDNSYATALTLELLQQLKPSLLVNIGISGLVDDDYHLGDVVIAESSENITYRAKVVDAGRDEGEARGKEAPSFEDIRLGGDVIPSYYSFHRVLEHYERTYSESWQRWVDASLRMIEDEVNRSNVEYLEAQLLLALPPRKVSGPVVTGPWVGASKELKQWLKNNGNRNYLAMDTESWGVLNGARSYSPELRTLVIRGISDPADERKKKLEGINGGALRKWSMANASRLFASFIENHWGDRYALTAASDGAFALEEQKVQLEESIHNTCAKIFLPPPYNIRSRVIERGYAAYSDLFAIICDSPPEAHSDFFEHLTQTILSSDDLNPLLIEGLPGTGKSSLLSTLYWFLLDKRHADNSMPLPVFVNLHRYNEISIKGRRAGKSDASAIDMMREELVPLQNYLRNYPTEPVLIIIDGYDEFARFKEATFAYISELVQQSRHSKIIGSREGVDSLYGGTIQVNPAITKSLRPINVNDKLFEELIHRFVVIWAPSSTTALDKGEMSSRIRTGVAECKIKWVDLFILSLIAEYKAYRPVAPTQTLLHLLDNYCRKYIRQRNTGPFKSIEELLYYASIIAFNYQVENKRVIPGEGEELILWDLVQQHSRLCDYLTAYYVANEFIGLASKEPAMANKLKYVYPHRINRLTKELINREQKKQIEFAQMVDNLITVKSVDDYAKAQACYLAGRLKDQQAKRIALEALQKYKSRFMSLGPRKQAKSKRGGPDAEKISRNNRLLLERTIYISMAYLGDERAEADYIDILFESRKMDLINRGFHLEYYGDQEYDPTKPLTNLDDLQDCPKTFSQLTQNLLQGPNENPIFEIELHTLCSLAQKRHEIGRLEQSQRLNIISLLEQVTERYNIKHNKLHVYVRMLKQHLKQEDFDVSRVFSSLYSIKQQKRSGWVKRGIDRGESVADHTYGTYLIGLLFLPKTLVDQPEYSKSKILNMLLIHDLSEAITGDVLPEQSDERSKWLERAVYEEIGLYGTYEQLEDTSDVFTLWDEFEARQTLNARIAKEIDKIDNLIQLSMYHPEYQIEDVTEWRNELREVVKTEVGKSILRRVEGIINQI